MNHTAQSSYDGKTLLVVSTGSIKKRFILQKMKRMGLTLVALNKEKNWAAPYVDHWILADTNNYKESVNQVKLFIKNNPNIKIDGCLTFWDDSVLLVAKFVDTFNFTGIPYEAAHRTKNKHLFRAFCKENNLPSPEHRLLEKQEDIARISEELDFPLVVKPIYGASSSFVVKVENEAELKETYEYIKQNIATHPDSVEWDSFEILAEEYIDGDEVDIDILLQNGKIKFYSITDNAQTEEPFFIETGFSIPSSLPEKSQDDLISIAEEVLEKLGVQHGCIHFEAKSTRNGPVPVEVNLRMGGDEVYSFVKGAWEVDLIEGAVDIALNQYIKKIVKPVQPRKYLTGYDFLVDHSGIVVKLDVEPDLRKQKYLEEIHFFKTVGDPILTPPEGYEYLGWITVSGENLPDAQDNLKSSLKYINYDVARFHSASSFGKTLRKSRFSYAALNQDIVKNVAKIARLRRVSLENQRNLHIGIACNIYEEVNQEIENEFMAIGKNIENVLKERGYRVTLLNFNDVSGVMKQLKEADIDLVFNACERVNNSNLNKPYAVSLLETLQIPYTGSNPATLSICMDKIKFKKILAYHNIPTPKWDCVYALDETIREDLQYPLIAKPANTDNSIGITNESVVQNKEELASQLKKIIEELGRPALIEEYIDGDEYDVSILGSDERDLRVLPLSRAIFKDLLPPYWHIYSYEAKFKSDPIYQSIVTQRPAKNITRKLESLISEIALDTYTILECQDYGRVEIRVDQYDNPYVLELNPNPLLNQKSCIVAVSQLVGLDYGHLIEEIISMAIHRYQAEFKTNELIAV